jgi:predicted DNA-binding transcriptional regulator AlpA
MPTTEDLTHTYTYVQMEHVCNLDKKTIRRMELSGAIPPPVRIGTGRRKRVRFLAATVRRWLALGCPKAADFARQAAEEGGAR